MAVYEPSFSGLKLSTSAINNLSLTKDDLRGYFSENDLKPLLAQDDCIGIRFYNVKRINRAGFLYAVAVNADGFDLPESIHLQCHSADEPVFGNKRSTSSQISREHAAISIGALKSIGQLEEQFSSFFLKDTLEMLLKDPRFTGICFYKTTMEAVPSNLLPASIDPIGKLTHIAVTSDINNGQIVGVDSSLAFDNVFSDRPCPGHCVKLDAAENPIVADQPLIVAEGDFRGPYIPAWD